MQTYRYAHHQMGDAAFLHIGVKEVEEVEGRREFYGRGKQSE